MTSIRALPIGIVLVSLAAGYGAAPQQKPEPRSTPQSHAEPTCSTATLSGAYGFSISGRNYVRDVEWAFVGRFVVDGEGELTGFGTQSVKGKIGRTGKFFGKYEVRADCTGTSTMGFPGGPTSVLDFVLVDNGRELQMIVADEGVVEIGSAKRIFGAEATKSTPSSSSGGVR